MIQHECLASSDSQTLWYYRPLTKCH